MYWDYWVEARKNANVLGILKDSHPPKNNCALFGLVIVLFKALLCITEVFSISACFKQQRRFRSNWPRTSDRRKFLKEVLGDDTCTS